MVGIVTLVFGAFLIVVLVVAPVIGCLAAGEELTNAIMEPAMIAAMVAVVAPFYILGYICAQLHW